MFRSFLTVTLLFLVSTLAAPAPAPGPPPPPPPPGRFVKGGLSECSISIAGLTMQGTKTPAGGCRYSIKYGQVDERWGKSRLASQLDLSNAGSLPPQCPQRTGTYIDSGNQSEDCLYAVVSTPPNVGPRSSLPVLTWLHGGSFMEGGASSPGLDGSTLAVKGNIIVFVLQYRLGVLGYLPPSSSSSSSDPNLGMLDIINGLTAISQHVQYLGGDAQKVTLAGQSSGAGMIRALLGAPSTRGLFRAAILQSDPMTYGFSPRSITDQLQAAYYAQPGLASCTDLKCLQALPVSTLLSAQIDLILSAPTTIPGVPAAEGEPPLYIAEVVFRPTHGTASLPYDPTSLLSSNPNGLSIRPRDLPIMLTTTANEGGTVVQSLFPDAIPQSDDVLGFVLAQLEGPDRTVQILSAPSYAASVFSTADGFRERMEKIITDGVWRCSTRNVASQWATAGGTVYVGEWRQGASYPNNEGRGYCQGKVCHEDDIFPTFSTAPNPSGDLATFEDETLNRWVSFIKTLNPNPATSFGQRWFSWCKPKPRAATDKWQKYSSNGDEKGVFALGGDGKVTSCPAGLWGKSLPFEWQLHQ